MATCLIDGDVQVVAYIASHYRRDKIWLRRTRPDQRQYQVLCSLLSHLSLAMHSQQEGTGGPSAQGASQWLIAAAAQTWSLSSRSTHAPVSADLRPSGRVDVMLCHALQLPLLSESPSH